MTVTVKFEVDTLVGQPELFPGTDTLKHSLHEALCLLIHEGDEDALQWLMDNVADVK
jgi:hypothetical protein